eukprot:scaffold2347_cov134-Cylindrotheca_fusiformis.AAC.1
MSRVDNSFGMRIRVPYYNKSQRELYRPGGGITKVDYSNNWWNEVLDSAIFNHVWAFTGSRWPLTLTIIESSDTNSGVQRRLKTDFSFMQLKGELEAQLHDIKCSAAAIRFALRWRIRHYRELRGEEMREQQRNSVSAVRTCKPGIDRLFDLWRIHRTAFELTETLLRELTDRHGNGEENFDFRRYCFEGYPIDEETEDLFRNVAHYFGSVRLRQIGSQFELIVESQHLGIVTSMDYCPDKGDLVKEYVQGGGGNHWVSHERWLTQIHSRAKSGKILLQDSPWLEWDDVFDDPEEVELPDFPDEVVTLVCELRESRTYLVGIEDYMSGYRDSDTAGSSFEFESDDVDDEEPETEHHAE